MDRDIFINKIEGYTYFELVSEYNFLNTKKMHLEDNIDYLKENSFVEELSAALDAMRKIDDNLAVIKDRL
ncbi:hypothetical protein LI82_04155 [Methanococcoides methylutens]|uniref:Uncharacterized protein n=1 Tax=Methanococcoides methylutens TaxID=2226 RepID=A0A099T4U4_METMT|nr:hypothetical protein [Methanococcoides methylutens]KGK99221.1 hypothetical protein LI82_04155 [Methanococcoides methylutens]